MGVACPPLVGQVSWWRRFSTRTHSYLPSLLRPNWDTDPLSWGMIRPLYRISRTIRATCRRGRANLHLTVRSQELRLMLPRNHTATESMIWDVSRFVSTMIGS
uniref:Uncharacterized protein n=1 Tax=Cacopsylla melanoneura TaxID=428564 RepID=A0A8D9BAZ2_9HEMI